MYPTATHTRFSHSLGVAQRARELLATLAKRQPALGITPADLVVIELAGLCHDLGHGPLSHSFEAEVVPRMAALGELPHLHGRRWSHEDMSCTLFDRICEEYNVGIPQDQQQRVKDLISSEHTTRRVADWTGKEFMFDIVANKRSGLDVDRLDYLVRDNAACGALTNSEWSCLVDSVRVVGGEICFRCPVSTVAGVYHARSLMHEHCYHHTVLKGIEYMACEALFAARHELGIAEALMDPGRYCYLDDTVLRQLQRMPARSPGMQLAHDLMNRLMVRDIYKFCGSVEVPESKAAEMHHATPEDLAACWKSVAREASAQGRKCDGAPPAAVHSVELTAEDLRVTQLRITWSQCGESPLGQVGFWESEADEHPKHQLSAKFLPAVLVSREVRVYLARQCLKPEEKRAYMEAAQAALREWNRRYVQSQGLRTPAKSCHTEASRRRVSSDGAPSALPTVLQAPQSVGVTVEGSEGGPPSSTQHYSGLENGAEGTRDDDVVASQSNPKRVKRELFVKE